MFEKHHKHYSTLSSLPVSYHFNFPPFYHYHYSAPIISTNNEKHVFKSVNYSPHWRFDLFLNNNDVLPFYRSFFKFSQLLRDKRSVYPKYMKPGDLVVFNNRRVLHSRFPFTSLGNRLLRGTYVDLDDFHARYRAILHQS